MELSFKEASDLGQVWSLCYDLYNKMEDLRPGGGFKDFVGPGECNKCGAKTPNTKDDSQNSAQHLKAKICSYLDQVDESETTGKAITRVEIKRKLRKLTAVE